MAFIFDGPVAAIGGKYVFRLCLFRSAACDAICNFTGVFVGFFVSNLPLYHECLPYMREIQIVVKLGCGPYFASFDTTVIRGVVLSKIRLLSVFKMEGDVLQQCELVLFDGEMVMSVAFLDQIFGKFSLGQQRISGNDFAFNIN